MSALLSQGIKTRQTLPSQPQPTRPTNRRKPDVIVISDDEDKDEQLDVSSPNVAKRSPVSPSLNDTRGTLISEFDFAKGPNLLLHDPARRRMPETLKRSRYDEQDQKTNLQYATSDIRVIIPVITATKRKAVESLTRENPPLVPQTANAVLGKDDGAQESKEKSWLPPSIPTTGGFSVGFESNYSNFQDTTRQPLIPNKKPARRKKPERIAPYYDDPTLDTRMFRGPGYERFPVVLGSVEGHRQICDRWDEIQAAKFEKQKERQARYHELGNYLDEDIFVDSSDSETDGGFDEQEMETPQQICLQRILEVLPNIQHEFVIEKIKSKPSEVLNIDGEEISVEIDPNALLAEILELESYPQQDRPLVIEQESLDEIDTGKTIVWNKEMPKTLDYFKEAIIILANALEHVPTHFISKVVYDKKSMFWSYVHIEEMEANYYSLSPQPYRRLRNARVSIEKKYQRGLSGPRNLMQYWDMVNELQAAKQHIARVQAKQKRKEEHEAFELANVEQHRMENALVECQCCFDNEIPLNRAVSCQGSNLHWFCFGCVSRLADSQIGMMKYEMWCMDSSDCRAHLAIEGVRRAVAIKILDKLAFYQQQAEISAAGIEGLEQCPYCDFQAIVDPVEINSVFSCQNPECFRVTCRKCHADSHLPRTCEQVKEDRGLSARHLVEEARSEAIMRTCPGCKTKIIKEFGCNKMRCVKCGGVMCYVCKVDISKIKDNGYEHFNKKGRACVLYDKQDVDRHEQEAEHAEKEAIRQVKEKDADLDEEMLQVNVGKASNIKTKDVVVPQQPRPGDERDQPPRYEQVNELLDRMRERREQMQQQRIQRWELPRPGNGDIVHIQPNNDAERQRMHEFRMEHERRTRLQRERMTRINQNPHGFHPPNRNGADAFDAHLDALRRMLHAPQPVPDVDMRLPNHALPPPAFPHPIAEGPMPVAATIPGTINALIGEVPANHQDLGVPQVNQNHDWPLMPGWNPAMLEDAFIAPQPDNDVFVDAWDEFNIQYDGVH